ncbi:MAG: hypothetical protein IT350_11155 [Deltaproteobacteria bacterium]|nr:hypothetical protein [Deltaproteobacteria bacterium]
MPKALPRQHAAAWATPWEETVSRFETGPHLLLVLTSPLCDPSRAARANRALRERIDWTSREVPQDNSRRFLTRAIGDANATLFSAANSDGEPGSLPLSVVALWTNGIEVAYAHVGNARIYQLRDGMIRPVTQDHTQAQAMVDQALLKPEEARNHPFSREILRSLGRRPMIDVPVQGPVPAKNGDYYVLCSAGITRRLADSDIGNAIVEGELLDACHAIVQMAVDAGGDPEDILAVQAIRFGDQGGGRKVEAYNPIDNITRSLMRAETGAATFMSDKGLVARAVATIAMLIYLFVFAVCDPDCGSSVRRMEESFSGDEESTGEPVDEAPAEADAAEGDDAKAKTNGANSDKDGGGE